jgi:hypothetical protein
MQPNSPEQEVDQVYLTDLVRKALDRPALEVSVWKAQQLHGGLEWDSALFRFQGEAKDAGESIPWSLVLKAVKPTEKAGSPGGIWYWKREVLAYQSGLLHRLPGGNVTAPACHGVSERPDGSIWLWMEDMKDDIANPWPLEHYGVVARHLGQFNGAYLTGQAYPSEPWVTHNWLHMYVKNAAKMIEFIRRDPYHPVVMNMFPGNTLAQVLAIWEENEQILEVLEKLPQVFCHQDAFRRNLFARGGKTFAIDWGYMGVAPLGAELVALVAGSLGFFEIPAERVKELDRICFEGYLQGLREAGWSGDPKLVRRGYAVSLMLRYPIGGQLGELLPAFLDQERRSRMEAAFEDKTAAELEKVDPAIVTFYEGILPEALKLLGMKRLLGITGRIGVHTLQLVAGRRK